MSNKMDLNTRIIVGEVNKQLTIKGWTHSDLAKATGYSVETIRSFMSGRRNSVKLTNAISVALGMR